MNRKIFILNLPHVITSLRVLLIPVIVLNLNHGYWSAALGLFLLACLTDLADGFLARRLNVTSVMGAYLDVTADFLFFFTVISQLNGLNWIVDSVPVCMAISFFLFLGTSHQGNLVYDPLGKRSGLILAAYAIMIIISPTPKVLTTAAALTSGWLILSMVFRVVSLFRQRKQYALIDE